jgi:transposase
MTDKSMQKRIRLKVLMIKHSLSTERVADITGRTIRTVYSWTGGEREVPDAVLAYIESGEFMSEVKANG